VEVIIRETQAPDYQGISKLLEDTNLVQSYFTADAFRRYIERNKGFCFVAEVDGKIVGNIFGECDGAFKAYFGKLAVAESYRRKEIGTKLIDKFEGKADELAIPLRYAHVEKTNEASIRLLESRGFIIRKTHHLMDKGSPR